MKKLGLTILKKTIWGETLIDLYKKCNFIKLQIFK